MEIIDYLPDILKALATNSLAIVWYIFFIGTILSMVGIGNNPVSKVADGIISFVASGSFQKGNGQSYDGLQHQNEVNAEFEQELKEKEQYELSERKYEKIEGSEAIQPVYVGSVNSNKYHLLYCKWAQKIKSENLIEFSGEEEALDNGYIPCKVCNP